MDTIWISTSDLAIAAALVLMLALLTWRLHLGTGRQIVVSAIRTTVQLLLIGLVLKTLFTHAEPGWVALMSVVMLLLAGREVMVRQDHRFAGWWGYGLGTLTMFVSSFSVALLTLIALIEPEPWYDPRYAIPLLGMILGNTMTGISLALDSLTRLAIQQRPAIEARLMLGHGWREAIGEAERQSMRSGLMPVVNAMAAAGIVSLPGMMTGQILAGSPPMEAVKYQILIMFLIAIGTGFGTLAAIRLGARRLFDARERLRLDRLKH
ncbi:MAG: iron export ABC transporter permease subunit FetB [Gammaproteobacteria bacterium]|jgi:putative ABC transport system permease protein|nr:iron export ABC transporter permease subunit FetB [Gammaproteobacteria bacterium]